jgi:hypothetical protein
MSLQANEGAIVAGTAENAAERAAFQRGGGALRQKIAIAQADPEKTAERALNISENRLARSKQRELLQSGAAVDVAVNDAEREQLQMGNKGLARGMAGLAANAAANAGGSANDVRGASIAASGVVKGAQKNDPILQAFVGQFATAVNMFTGAVHEATRANKNRHNAAQAEAMQNQN